MALKQKTVDSDVLTLARQRMAHLYDLHDHIGVMFSGGKDSTVILQLAIEEARKRKRLPVDTVFFDEEAIHPETEAYVRRMSKSPDVALRWFCLPVKHRNGCSRKVPFWRPWDPAHKDLWTRPLPPEALTKLEGFSGQELRELPPHIFSGNGNVCQIMGIRADESMRRRQAVSRKIGDNYIVNWGPPSAWLTSAYPIYDWTKEDVWLAPKKFGWDYNHTYDLMDKAGISLHIQRVAPPYGEEATKCLWMWHQIAPELWDKIQRRVPGAATAARYAQGLLYAHGSAQLPEGVTWKDKLELYLKRWPPNVQALLVQRVKNLVGVHKRNTSDPLPDVEKHPKTGLSWAFLAMIVARGDFKGRKNRLGAIKPLSEQELADYAKEQNEVRAKRRW